jgi:TolB-like protein
MADAGQDPTGAAAVKAKKKREKVRSAWISFVGRIVAQLVGAIATITLGLIVVQGYQTSAREPAAAGAGSHAGTSGDWVRPQNDPRPSIVVLPLANFSDDAAVEPFADALTEVLVMELAQAGGLRVVSRTSSMHYKGTRKPLREIARELDVELVVEGSVVRSNGRIRVVAQLIDALTDQHLWAHSYERGPGDPLVLQAGIAREITKDLTVAVETP